MGTKRIRQQVDQCAFCERTAKLCKSHAIPDSLFRDMFKQGDGQAVRFTNGRPIHKSQESGKCYLLCAECERDFNVRFDTAGVNLLRGFRNQIDSDGGRRWHISHSDLATFVLSILWRAALSSADPYRGIILGGGKAHLFRKVLRKAKPDTLRHCAVRFWNIIDGYGVFAKHDMPFDTGVFWDTAPDRKQIWFGFTMNNFFAEIEIPGPRIKRKGTGYLDAAKETFEILDVDMHRDPNLSASMNEYLEKHRSGDVVEGYYSWSAKHHFRRTLPPKFPAETDELARRFVQYEEDLKSGSKRQLEI